MIAGKRVLISICCVSLACLVAFAAYAPRKYAVPILMYHSIDQNYGIYKTSVSPESFARQMKFLKDHRYNVISLKDLVDRMQSRKPIPRQAVVITFDDGYLNNYTHAYPVLKQCGFPAAIFIPYGSIGREGYLAADMLGEMSENGVDIESHTLSHAFLCRLDDENLEREIKGSKDAMEKLLHKKVDFLAYPGGGFNEKAKMIARQAGYIGAVATSPGEHYPNDDVYALKRVRISRSSDNLWWFRFCASGYYTWFKELRDEE